MQAEIPGEAAHDCEAPVYGCYIIPPFVLRHIAETTPKDEVRARAERALTLRRDVTRERTAALAERRDVPGERVRDARPRKNRIVYDANRTDNRHFRLARREGDEPNGNEPEVDEAFKHSGITWDFYNSVFGRNSIDGWGMDLISTVNYRRNFVNARWNGGQMLYGGDVPGLFNRFTKTLDIVAHELTHGVVQFTVGLDHVGQPGALGESICDVFGSMVKQWAKGQKAADADWLMGEGLYVRKKGARRRAVRSLKAPGTAHNDPTPGGIGIDPQVAHMSEYLKLPDDEDQGGVHLNSGIANRAFYLAATQLGGYSWEGAGQIWYRVLAERRIRPAATFADMRDATVRAATELFGDRAARTVAHAWAKVGVNGAPA